MIQTYYASDARGPLPRQMETRYPRRCRAGTGLYWP